jgi:hypothetical protein
MDIHPWTKYDVARARDEERLLRAMATYRSLRGHDGGAIGSTTEVRSERRLLDRLLRREVGNRAPAMPVAKSGV